MKRLLKESKMAYYSYKVNVCEGVTNDIYRITNYLLSKAMSEELPHEKHHKYFTRGSFVPRYFKCVCIRPLLNRVNSVQSTK